MPFLDSNPKGVRPFLPLILLFLQLIQLRCESGDTPSYKDCTEDLFVNSTRCVNPGTYHFKKNGETCRITVNSTQENCTLQESTGQTNRYVVDGDKGVSGRRLGTPDRQSKCEIRKNLANISRISLETECSIYLVNVCGPGLRRLSIYIETLGISMKCFGINFNGEKTRNFALTSDDDCGRKVLDFWLDVDKEFSVLTSRYPKGPAQTPLHGAMEFKLSICNYRCAVFRVQGVSMYDFSEGVRGCTVDDMETAKKVYTNCTHNNGTNPSKCWQRGCQYSKDTAKCITGKHSCETKTYKDCICSHKFCQKKYFNDTGDCSAEPVIFNNKLNCRRAKTYYVYHPKILCYNEIQRGNCDATATYSVNLGGGELVDYNGIGYIADKESNYRDPNSTRAAKTECQKIDGVRHKPSTKMYASTYVGDRFKDPSRDGACIYYPIAICQNGEYMLTIKLTEPRYTTPNSRCTEARINDVPIMIHMDTFSLARNKTCGLADVVLMFLAVGGDESNPKSNYSLQLKGHVNPIHVTAGAMDLQFCIGYECFNDQHPAISAFSLERLGNDTTACTRDIPTEQL